MGPELPALRAHHVLPVAQLRAVLPGRAPLLAVRSDAPRTGGCDRNRRRQGCAEEPTAQGATVRADVFQSRARNERGIAPQQDAGCCTPQQEFVPSSQPKFSADANGLKPLALPGAKQ